MINEWLETLEEVAAVRSIWGNEAFVTSSPGLTSLLDKVSEGAWDPSADPVMSDALRFSVQVGGGNGGGTMSLSIGASYPEAPPALSMVCEWLKRSQIDDILSQLQTIVIASSKVSERCLFSVVERLQKLIEVHHAHFSQQSEQSTGRSSENKQNPAPGLHVAILRIDHMHNRGNYTKIISRPEMSERKMSVLVKQPCTSRAFLEFETVESDEVQHVDSLFEKAGLGPLIKNIMQLS